MWMPCGCHLDVMARQKYPVETIAQCELVKMAELVGKNEKNRSSNGQLKTDLRRNHVKDFENKHNG
jgi:hypothetical protein